MSVLCHVHHLLPCLYKADKIWLMTSLKEETEKLKAENEKLRQENEKLQEKNKLV